METKSKISPAVKHFFFSAFKSQRNMKELAKEIGPIDSVSVIFTQEKKILRAKNSAKQVDVPFTDEEARKFIKGLSIKEKTLQESKHIFVMLDFNTKTIFVKNVKLSGEVVEFQI